MDNAIRTRFVQLTGPSGSGKTTRLKAYLLKRRSLNKECIYLPQSLELSTHPLNKTLFLEKERGVYQEFLSNLKKQHLIEVIESGRHLEDHKLSGGETQIIKLASIINYRNVVVADEPFSALDNDLRLSVEEYLCHAMQAKMFIFTSHQFFSKRHKKIKVIRKNLL